MKKSNSKKFDSSDQEELVRILDWYAEELRWINDNQFCAWVPWIEIYDFLNELKESFGSAIFDEPKEMNANIQERYICFDLTEMFSGRDGFIEDTYPKGQQPTTEVAGLRKQARVD